MSENQNLQSLMRLFSNTSHFKKSKILIENGEKFFYSTSRMEYRFSNPIFLNIEIEIQDKKILQRLGSDFSLAGDLFPKGSLINVVKSFYATSPDCFLRKVSWVEAGGSFLGAHLSSPWSLDNGEFVYDEISADMKSVILVPITVENVELCYNINKFLKAVN